MTAVAEPLSARSRRATAIRVGVMGILVTSVAQFYRNAHVVVAPDIMRDVGVSAQLFGMLSACLFIAAAASQLPAGMLIDKYGPRRTIPAMLCFCVIGAVLFSTATSGFGLLLGRMFVGIGMAALGMSVLVACSRWFPLNQFSMVVGVVLGLGHLGNVLATYPMAHVSEVIGWRNSYLIMTGVTAALGILSYILIRDAPPDHPYHQRKPEQLRDLLNGIGEVVKTPGMPKLLTMAFMAYAVIVSIIGLWAGPYLHDVHGLDLVQRGNVLLLFTLGMLAGNVAFGWLERQINRPKLTIMSGAVLAITILLILVVWPDAPLPVAATLLIGLGCLNGYTLVIIVHGRGFYPDRLMGRGTTIVNLSVLSGAAVLQGMTGLIAGLLAPGQSILPLWAYQVIFATLAASLGLALAVYSTCPDKPRSGTSN